MSVTEGEKTTMTPPPGASAAGEPVDDGPDTLLPLIQEATQGDYEIIGELGRGGMAAVYLATDVSLNRKVAIKTMLPELTGRQSMVQRFKREAQMAAGLSHPHIVQIHSVKQTNRLVYFVMKFIEGRGLESIIDTHGALDLDMTRLILQQAASALSFAHHRGVVHRDVKPANIMIDENGWAVMTDFGIAKVDDGSNLTATGTTVGTPHYMAPEQFHNEPLTAAADQYALGIVAYEMLTGKKPFDGTTMAEIITQQLFKDPPDIMQDRPDLPLKVSQTIQRMLAKKPAERFPDLDAAIASMGAPEQVESARGRLVSFARSSPEKKPRLSVPMSPVPLTRPSAPTAVIDRVSGKRAPVAPLPVRPPRERSFMGLWIFIAVVVLAVPGYFGARRFMANRGTPVAAQNPSLQRGVALWQQGNTAAALPLFTDAAREMPASALPHIYLSRLARQRGDLNVALGEATRAAQLEPNNALALRELGFVLLTRGNVPAARRFFVRALRSAPTDKTAMGGLACSLQRLGQADLATRWATRAGMRDLSGCPR